MDHTEDYDLKKIFGFGELNILIIRRRQLGLTENQKKIYKYKGGKGEENLN